MHAPYIQFASSTNIFYTEGKMIRPEMLIVLAAKFEKKLTDKIWRISAVFDVLKHVTIPMHEKDKDIQGTMYVCSGHSYCDIV